MPRSSYNEKGEEVTEMVWEEDPDEPELGTAGSADTSSAALKELSGIPWHVSLSANAHPRCSQIILVCFRIDVLPVLTAMSLSASYSVAMKSEMTVHAVVLGGWLQLRPIYDFLLLL